MCVEQKCVDFIKKIIENPSTKDLIITEGKLTISNILASKIDIPPEEELNLKKLDNKVTKEIRNFLIAGKICRMYFIPLTITFYLNLVTKKMGRLKKCTFS